MYFFLPYLNWAFLDVLIHLYFHWRFLVLIHCCWDVYFIYRKGYAIVMNTWKRYDLLKQSISHYTTCDWLDSIHIVWSEPNPPTDSLKDFLNHIIQSNSRNGRQVELKFDINTEDSLNNRFKEIKDLKTDAVFSIDDDIIFPCSTVDFAFNVWQSAPDTMVGFVPRAHWVDRTVCLIKNYFPLLLKSFIVILAYLKFIKVCYLLILFQCS